MAELAPLCALLVLLLFLLAARGLLRRGASPARAARRPGGALALVLVGRAPRYAARRAAALVRLCHWPESVRCYARDSASLGDGPSVWPLELLEKSACPLAVLLPWDIDPVQSWDWHLCQALHGKKPGALYSSRLRSQHGARASAPPEVVFPSRAAGLVVPDFRFAAGPPRAVARVARGWFPSFFAGLLAFPWPTRHLATTIAHDSQAYGEELTSSDRETLLALGADGGGGGLDPLIWQLLFESPPPYLRLS